MSELTILQEAHAVARKIKPTGERVLVRLRKDLQKVGLIYLPNGGQALDIVCSEVVALGPEVKARPWELAVGDYVLHARVCGVAYDGVLGLLGKDSQSVKTADYKIILEKELMAVVDPSAVGKIEGHGSYSDGATGVRATADL